MPTSDHPFPGFARTAAKADNGALYAREPTAMTTTAPRPRILIVDDEEAILETMAFTFEDDYDVLTATSARQALELLDASGPIAAVITDQRMPEMTGVEFLARVCERHPNTTRIILTGYADGEAMVRAINEGHVYAYVTKPWEPEELKQLVRDAAAIEPGSVLVIDDCGELRESTSAYDRRVAGVVSGGGSFAPGIVLDKQRGLGDRKPVALIGKVYCKVDADCGAVAVGDLLTSAPTRGHAMKAADPQRAFGAVIGKALAPLSRGRALIPILVALQ